MQFFGVGEGDVFTITLVSDLLDQSQFFYFLYQVQNRKWLYLVKYALRVCIRIQEYVLEGDIRHSLTHHLGSMVECPWYSYSVKPPPDR